MQQATFNGYPVVREARFAVESEGVRMEVAVRIVADCVRAKWNRYSVKVTSWAGDAPLGTLQTHQYLNRYGAKLGFDERVEKLQSMGFSKV